MEGQPATQQRRCRIGKAVTVAGAPTPQVTARDQVGALAAGAHPRCGARCPLRLMSIMGCTGDGALAVRVVWLWLMSDDSTRFYCVKWENDKWGDVMIAFGVSLVLLSLTHDMRWWVERENDCVYGANRDFIVLERGWVLCLQDRATGQASLVLDGGKEWDHTSSNGKWLLLCDNTNQRMAVVEIPRKSTPVGATTAIKKPVVVQIGGGWNSHLPQFTDINEDCVLLDCQQVDEQNHCGLVLVDLAQTCASGKLAVLSSTVVRVGDLPPQFSRLGLYGSCLAFHTQSDAYYFVVGNGGNGYINGQDSYDEFTPSSGYITIEGATGKSHPTFQGESRYLLINTKCGM
ncbi:hypothetical protein Pelo_18903 [Pelomyxa schiedti]|nr:hypothetical protein Pelo_18903 [Pelomyxa schiedti]